MDTATLAAKQQDYDRHRAKALAITDLATKEDRRLTQVEADQMSRHVEQAKALKAEVAEHEAQVKATQMVDQALAATGIKAASGQRERHPWTKALLEASTRGAFGEKGITGGGQGSVMVGSLGDPAARLGAPGGELLALLTVEDWGTRGDGSVVNFLRQSSRALHAAIVPVAGAKPASDIGLDMLTADLWTFAHHVPGVPLQWMQDSANLDQLISAELAYGVQLAIENGLVNGAGPLPGAPLGILHDPAVQQAPFDTDAPGSILGGLTMVSSAGYGTGAVALNPADWEDILGMKDLQERPIYGGSPFAGPQRTLWSAPVVLSNAIPAGSSIVGDIGGAVRLVEREPVQVFSGTVNDELTKNLRTFVGESRCAFATVRPQALAKVDLTATRHARRTRQQEVAM